MNNWKHKWFGFWRESPDFPETPSIRQWISPNWCSLSDKNRFIEFLANGVVLDVSQADYPKCPICGEIVDGSFAFMSDGYWVWSNDLVHQVQEHDIRLPEAFVQHIRAQEFQVTPPRVKDEDALIRSLDWSMLVRSPRTLGPHAIR